MSYTPSADGATVTFGSGTTFLVDQNNRSYDFLPNGSNTASTSLCDGGATAATSAQIKQFKYRGVVYTTDGTNIWQFFSAATGTAQVHSICAGSSAAAFAVPSATGKLVNVGAAGIIDTNLDVWGCGFITTSPRRTVTKNGIEIAGTDHSQMYFDGASVYYKDGSSAWHKWNGTAFVSSSDPTVVAAPAIYIAPGQGSFTDSAGNVFTIDTGINLWMTPPGGTATALGVYGDIGWNAKQAAYYNSLVYVQDARDNTWHNYTPSTHTFSGSVTAPPSGSPAPSKFVGALWSDDFSGSAISLYNHANPGAGGTWQPSGLDSSTWDGVAVNDAWMVSPFVTTALASLFTTDGNGDAVLGFAQTPSNLLSVCGNKPYVAAQLCAPSLARVQGYFEARLKLPNIQGTNFAFWLYPTAAGSGYQEIDVLEFVNGGSWFLASQNLWNTDQTTNPVYNWKDTTWFNDFHTYAVDWQSDFVTFYVDGVQTGKFPTPAGYTRTMMPILSCQQGGSWSGPVPSGATMGNMVVDYVAAWPNKATRDGSGTVAPSGQPPAPAAQVGYNTLTYGPSVKLGTNWFGLSGSNLTQNADGSVTDHGGVPNNWNAHCTPCIGTTGDQSGTLKGCAFGGGGYFEMEFSWSNPPSEGYQDANGNHTDGWPSFWSTTAEHDFTYLGDLPNRQNLELDSYEAMGPADTDFNCGIIHWYTDTPGTNWNNNNSNISGNAFAPSGTDVTQRHKVGVLWVPATATSAGYVNTYYDGLLVKTYTWSQYNGGSVPGIGPGDVPPFSAMDAGRRRFWFGTGTKNAMTVYSFVAWQKNASANVTG